MRQQITCIISQQTAERGRQMTKAINRLIPQPAGEVTRTTMHLDERTRDTARKVGDGSMSAGWRLLAAAARQRAAT